MALGIGDRACCCPARPAVRVWMPRSDARPSVDLLLCFHHYRVSQDTLRAAGAIVYDASGALVQSGAGSDAAPEWADTSPGR